MMILNQYNMPDLRPPMVFDDTGRYVVPDPEAGNPKVIAHKMRTSTFIEVIAETSKLEAWEDRMIVQGMAMAPQLLARVDLNKDPKDQRDNLQQIAAQAFTASGAEVRRERGTQLHYFTEALDIGFAQIEQIPAEYQAEVRAYRQAVEAAGFAIDPTTVERVLWTPETDTVGTADRVPVQMPDGRYVILDVKSGADLKWSWPEIAMQLAIYAHARKMLYWDVQDEAWHWVDAPIVDQDVAIVAHIPVDGQTCELYEVNIALGWQDAMLAKQVWERQLRGIPVSRKYDPKRWVAAPAGPSEPLPDLFGIVPPDPEAPADVPVDEYDVPLPMVDQLRQALEVAKSGAVDALAARKAAGHKRRTKKMIEADELADIALDGEPVAEVFENAITALTAAYGLDKVEPDRGPEPDAPFRITAAEGTTGEDLSDMAAIVEGAPLTESRRVTQPDGTVMVPAPDVNGYTIIPPSQPADSEAVTGSPFDDFDQKISIEATITDALDHCETAADMTAVYHEFASDWSDAMTEYGRTVLANKKNN